VNVLPWLTRLLGAAQVRGGSATLSPLARERDSGLWVERCSAHGSSSSGIERNGASASVSAALASLRRLDAAYAQRAVADRVANPHGEHAENTWEARCKSACARAFVIAATFLTHLCSGFCARVRTQLLVELPAGVLFGDEET
jgi:hypothetical protein